MQKNNRGSLDTNVLLRLVVGDVPEQTHLIKELFEKATVLDVADIVIFEMVFVLDRIYKFSREDIAESVFAVIRSEKISCNRTLFELTLPVYLKNNRLSFVDCTLPQYALLTSSEPLFTFDTELAKSYDFVTLLG